MGLLLCGMLLLSVLLSNISQVISSGNSLAALAIMNADVALGSGWDWNFRYFVNREHRETPELDSGVSHVPRG